MSMVTFNVMVRLSVTGHWR